MADNVAITAGSGTTIATDEISDVHYQRVKLVDGALGDTDAISGDATYGLDVDPTRLPAGEVHLGEIGGKTLLPTVTFTLDTNAYASGDVLADTQALANALRVADGTGLLVSAQFVDGDDQGGAFDVYILQANTSIGTENAAPSISDANATAAILGFFSVLTSDWKDLGGCRVANIRNINLPVKAASGTTSLYVALVNGTGTPTFTANGITAIFGILGD